MCGLKHHLLLAKEFFIGLVFAQFYNTIEAAHTDKRARTHARDSVRNSVSHIPHVNRVVVVFSVLLLSTYNVLTFSLCVAHGSCTRIRAAHSPYQIHTNLPQTCGASIFYIRRSYTQ